MVQGDIDPAFNPLDFIKVADIQCDCDKQDKVLYEQILGNLGDADDEVMAYNTCAHTIYGAAKRQMKAAPTPEPKVADEFVQYCMNIIEDEIGEELNHFGYSYQQWYNHLERKKQNDMDLVNRYFTGLPMTRAEIQRVIQTHYEGICKVEIQDVKGKPRMVCSIPLQTKYIMGPITWQLEEICAHYLKGYCGGKNLDEMADMISGYIKEGFTKVVEGDGSAFDNTQDVSLKEVDRYIYRRVANQVYHVDRDKFLEISQEWCKTMDVIYTDVFTKKRKNMFSYTILGSVFSGDCDTTLCNTIRMAMYNRFVNDKAGLKYGEDYICFAKGDDFTVMYKDYITDEQINKMYYKYFLPANPDPDKPDTRVYGLGQVLKMLDIGGPEIIKFCSLRAWLTKEDEIILTRDPKKFYNLAKYSRKAKNMKDYELIQYLLEQAISLEVSYQGIDIFDTMAQCYRWRAKFIALKNHTTYTQFKQAEQIAEERIRQKYSAYQMKETECERMVFDIKYRDEFYKIQGQYWDYMKSYERVRFRKLNPDELARVNQQVNAEFSCEELRSVLGLDEKRASKSK